MNLRGHFPFPGQCLWGKISQDTRSKTSLNKEFVGYI